MASMTDESEAIRMIATSLVVTCAWLLGALQGWNRAMASVADRFARLGWQDQLDRIDLPVRESTTNEAGPAGPGGAA